VRPEPDIEITALVRADELRFECTPHADVRVHAESPADAERVSDRENLPDEVEPGVTYRDVAVTWRVAARLRDPDF
jgi:hypothetical protein